MRALSRLVPQPIAVGNNAILMGYCGDENRPAHTLNEIRLNLEEARSLLEIVLQNIELLLSFDLIHGDLSAYNILYWQGEVTLIDFPQVVNGHSNKHAYAILERDILRICQYFQAQGVPCEVQLLTETLWQQHFALPTPAQLADQSQWEYEHSLYDDHCL